MGKKEELSCDGDSAKASADLLGHSEAKMALQNCLSWGGMSLQPVGYRQPQEGDRTWSKAAFFSWGKS